MAFKLGLLFMFGFYIRNAHGFWRLECDGSVGLARLDPLMSFNSIGDHVHTIKGGSSFGPSSTAQDLLGSNCTSCGVAQDLSAYWTPAMYFMHDDGTVEVVPEKPPHKSYYLLNTGLTHDGKQQVVEPFPNGFQMIAGNNLNRNTTLPNPDPKPLGPWPEESQAERAQRAIGFNCLHYAAGNDEPTLMRHGLPNKTFIDTTCTDGIRLELAFASCWDGNMDGGPLHKSHVAYPDGVTVGNCPEGFDRRLVTLFYETIVATDKFKTKDGQFVLSNGDPTGYGYHGDFIAAWKDDTLAKAVSSCNSQDSSGVMSACPVFELTQRSQDCQLQALPPAISHEDVKGPMKGLANGLQVAYGPAPAPKPGNAAPPAIPANTLSSVPVTQNEMPTAALPSISSPLKSFPAKPAIGQVHEKDAMKPSLNTASLAPAPTAAATYPSAINSQNEEAITTIYSTVGQELHEIVQILERVTIDVPPPGATAGVAEPLHPATAQKRAVPRHAHLKRHLHAHKRHRIG